MRYTTAKAVMTPSTTITGKLLRKISHAAVTKPSFVNASARAVKIPEIRTALKPPQKPASFSLLFADLPAIA